MVKVNVPAKFLTRNFAGTFTLTTVINNVKVNVPATRAAHQKLCRHIHYTLLITVVKVNACKVYGEPL